MDIYMVVIADELADVIEPVAEAITQALADETIKGELIDDRQDDDAQQWRVGLQLNVSKKKWLQQPLNFLFGLCKADKIDFVVGFYEDGNPEDVCYFGHNEGKPDLFEIGTYLGLK